LTDINVQISESENENIVVESQDINVSEAVENLNFTVVEDNVIATMVETEIVNIAITEAVGEPGKQIELQKSATHIQWRYVGDTVWINLVALSDLGGGGGGGTALTVVNADGTNETLNVGIIRLDQSTGISVTHSAEGEVTIGLGSSFKTWKVAGQSDLVAEGEDTIEIIAGANVTITTDPTANPKTITIASHQDVSAFAEKTNVLEKDNTTPFTPSGDYQPATKKYVDDNAGGGGATDNAKYFRRDIVSRTLAYSATNEVSDSDADANWKVVKMIQLDNNNAVRTIMTAIGSWTGRAGLTYATKNNYEV